MRNLRIVAIELTDNCNLNCSFCVRNASSQNTKKIPIYKYKKFLEILSNLNSKPDIAITGGEPFLHPNIKEILEETIKSNFRFSINTNGTIEKEDVFSICKSTKLFKYFIISLDSYNELVHNQIRGTNNAYQRTLQFISTLKDQGLSFAINMTINEKNITDIDGTIKFVNSISAKYISIASVKPSGRGKAELNFEQIKKIAEQVKNNQYLMNDDFKLYIAEATFFLYDMKNYIDAIKKGEKWSCAFGNSTLHVRVNGDILGCTTCDLVLGNIFSQNRFDLNEFWKCNEILKMVRDKTNLIGICGSCKYRDFCGGCRCRAYALSKNLFGDDTYCPIVMEHINHEKNA